MTSTGALLVLRLSALGDILHTLPAVEALRASFPSRPIGWVVERPYAELVELIAPVDRVFTVATKRWRRGIVRRETVRDVRESLGSVRSFARRGTSVDFQGLNKSAILGWLARASDRYGFDHSSIRERSATVWTNRQVQVDASKHVVEQNLELAAALGASPAHPALSRLGRLAEDATGELGELVARHPVLLNPGAGHPSKLWPTERFAELARRLKSRTGTAPLVIWGPSERVLAEEIAANGDATVAPETNLRQLAFLLQNARLLVAADTGPLHLAAAFGTRAVGLFGPTNPWRNGPYGQIDACVETYSSDRTMESISVDAVEKRAEEQLR